MARVLPVGAFAKLLENTLNTVYGSAYNNINPKFEMLLEPNEAAPLIAMLEEADRADSRE